jgi:adenylyltransferase/sulfurtransferase
MSATIPETSVEDLKALIDSKKKFILLDVREPFEWDIARIEGAMLIPLGELASRLRELNPADEIVVQCKSGGRSARAVEFLQENGFSHVSNLVGGILAWADRIDPSVERY